MSEGDFSEPILRYDSREGDTNFVDVQKNPLKAAKNNNQKVEIHTVEFASSLIAEGAERSKKILMKDGAFTEIEADAMAKSPDPISAKAMDRIVTSALDNGVDGHAILSAIHKGSVDGGRRSKNSQFKNWIDDVVESIRNKIAFK